MIRTAAITNALAAVAFESVFGHFAMGHPWSRLPADDTIVAGRCEPRHPRGHDITRHA